MRSQRGVGPSGRHAPSLSWVGLAFFTLACSSVEPCCDDIVPPPQTVCIDAPAGFELRGGRLTVTSKPRPEETCTAHLEPERGGCAWIETTFRHDEPLTISVCACDLAPVTVDGTWVERPHPDPACSHLTRSDLLHPDLSMREEPGACAEECLLRPDAGPP